MKLIFDKLRTSDGIVKVSFNNGNSWSQYNVSDVIDTGITFTEEDCPDLTKIRIAGAITQISDIKTHIMNEAISQDLTTDEKIEELRLQNEILKNRFENYQFKKNPKYAYFTNVVPTRVEETSETLYKYTVEIPLSSNIRLPDNNGDYLSPSQITSTTFPDFTRIEEAITNVHTISEIQNYSDIIQPSTAIPKIFNNGYDTDYITIGQLSTALNVLPETPVREDIRVQITGDLLGGLLTDNTLTEQQANWVARYSNYLITFYIDTQEYLTGCLDENSDTINIMHMVSNLHNSIVPDGQLELYESEDYLPPSHSEHELTAQIFVHPSFYNITASTITGHSATYGEKTWIEDMLPYVDCINENGDIESVLIRILSLLITTTISTQYSQNTISQILSHDLGQCYQNLNFSLNLGDFNITNSRYFRKTDDTLYLTIYRQNIIDEDVSLQYQELEF